MSVVVVGSANLDLVYRVTRIPGPGETVLATGYASAPGGKGNNQVTAAARAGADATFIAALGRDSAADQILESLRASGVDSRIRRVEVASGTALITVDDSAENTIVVNAGANARLLGLDASESALISASTLLLLQLESPLETVLDAARVAHNVGVTVVLNAAPIRPLPAELLARVDLLIVNEHEAEQLARDIRTARGGSVSTSAAEYERDELAEILTGLGLAVIITLGPDGSLVCVPGEPPAHVAGIHVNAVDTTGAGDTYCGALVAALDAAGAAGARGAGAVNGAEAASEAAGGTVPELDALVAAAEFATVAAALSVQRNGAIPSIPTREEIERFRALIADAGARPSGGTA